MVQILENISLEIGQVFPQPLYPCKAHAGKSVPSHTALERDGHNPLRSTQRCAARKEAARNAEESAQERPETAPPCPENPPHRDRIDPAPTSPRRQRTQKV